MIPKKKKKMIDNEANGFIIKHDDDWKKSLCLLEDETIRRRIRKRGFELAKKHKLDKVIDQWISSLGVEKVRNVENADLLSLKKALYKRLSTMHNYYKKEYLSLENNVLLSFSFIAKMKMINIIKRIYRR